ncbi:DUF6777 domain-containing protein [Streptomyces sp. NPDC047009]|uniref:DUF6777 domain-containing protein n=1 Tax=unclassified Streptomyces TaxID=2593676 RepID=UPI0033F1F810
MPARAFAAVGTLSATALLCAGCAGADSISAVPTGGEVFLQPVEASDPDSFTDSTVRSAASPRPVTRLPEPTVDEALSAARSVSGATPGLYGGTRSAPSCDIERQIALLTADATKARAFAQAAGIDQASLRDRLRGLTSVVLRADTLVTLHGLRDGQATARQSVLEAGTAVLVDNRGVPRVRCAGGNPISEPARLQGTPAIQGRPWSGYRPGQVVVVTPAPQIILNIMIINIEDKDTWIERRIGDDGRRDVVVPPPPGRDSGSSEDRMRTPDTEDTRTEQPEEHADESEEVPDERDAPPLDTPSPSGTGAAPYEKSRLPARSGLDCVTPGATVTVAPKGQPSQSGQSPAETTKRGDDCAAPTIVAAPSSAPSGSGTPSATAAAPPAAATAPAASPTADAPPVSPSAPASPPSAPDASASLHSPGEDTGPAGVPETSGVADGGGPVPQATGTESPLLDSPARILGH